MRRLVIAAAVASAAGAMALAALADDAQRPPGNPALVDALSGIDFVPQPATLEDLLGDDPVAELIDIARDPVVDQGVRIRAYRALAAYEGNEDVLSALEDALDEHDGAGSSGVHVVYLRAAIESYALVARAGGVEKLVPLLTDTSRDIRAATARALAVCGSPAAIVPLREQLETEEVAQVRQALSEALRALQQ